MAKKHTNRSDFTLAEAVSCIAFYVCGTDGEFHEDELTVILEDPFFLRFDAYSHASLFKDLVKAGNIIDIMHEEMSKSFTGCDLQFKQELIIAIVRIINADGNIEEDEIQALHFAGSIVGLKPKEVNQILVNENERMQAIIDDKRKAINAPPSSSNDGCFIATATMGDYDHPVVLDLRIYRDRTLKKAWFGRFMIKVYYRLGPYLANIIADSDRLRSLSLKYLIKPIHRMVIKKL